LLEKQTSIDFVMLMNESVANERAMVQEPVESQEQVCRATKELPVGVFYLALPSVVKKRSGGTMGEVTGKEGYNKKKRFSGEERYTCKEEMLCDR
jgi:hypothetical protein